ncbi:MAG: RNA methyltransferase [Rhodocyclaceae bacterium]|jgi:TrmH family RNA methyltransferase|nr:RNA methyltransferase [Rhodocyclaceae bacterium]
MPNDRLSSLITLRSRDNPRLKLLHALSRASRDRRKHGLTLLDGPHLLQAAADVGWPLLELFVSDRGLHDPEILAVLARHPEVPLTLLTEGCFAHVSPVDTPSGVLALMQYPASPAGVGHPDAVRVLLEGVQDPGNLGTIIRTAAAAGVDTVLLTHGSTQAWSPRALRAGMGGHFGLRIIENVDPAQVFDGFQGKVLATELSERAHPLYALDLHGPSVWLFGAEGAGLSPVLAARANCHVTIPMSGAVESLNVGAAVAICLFEQYRQRNCAPR